MADTNTLKDKIRSTIYPNGKGAINAADHQALLLDMADGMAETDTKLTELSERIDEIESGKGNDAHVDGETLVFGGSSSAQVIGDTLKL